MNTDLLLLKLFYSLANQKIEFWIEIHSFLQFIHRSFWTLKIEHMKWCIRMFYRRRCVFIILSSPSVALPWIAQFSTRTIVKVFTWKIMLNSTINKMLLNKLLSFRIVRNFQMLLKTSTSTYHMNTITTPEICPSHLEYSS